ncbi:hypothetical protein ACFLYA_02315 [Candidatus Dependentiae bacterium]
MSKKIQLFLLLSVSLFSINTICMQQDQANNQPNNSSTRDKIKKTWKTVKKVFNKIKKDLDVLCTEIPTIELDEDEKRMIKRLYEAKRDYQRLEDNINRRDRLAKERKGQILARLTARIQANQN